MSYFSLFFWSPFLCWDKHRKLYGCFDNQLMKLVKRNTSFNNWHILKHVIFCQQPRKLQCHYFCLFFIAQPCYALKNACVTIRPCSVQTLQMFLCSSTFLRIEKRVRDNESIFSIDFTSSQYTGPKSKTSIGWNGVIARSQQCQILANAFWK